MRVLISALVATLLLVGCGPKEEPYVPPNTTQLQQPITDLGPEAAMKRVEAATRYLLGYVEEVGKFPDARTALDVKELLEEHYGDKVRSLGGGDELTGFDVAWIRNDGKGPLLYNYALSGKSPDEIRNKENTWLLEDPIQFPEAGNIVSYVSGRVAAVKRLPVAGGMG